VAVGILINLTEGAEAMALLRGLTDS